MTNGSTIQVRPFHAGDEQQLVDLWLTCGLVRPVNDPYRDIALKLAQSPDLLLVAERGDDLVGSVMVGYEGHRGWINYLAVRPDMQRGGPGRALMQHAELRLRDLGCPKINLQVRESNTGVIAFYEKAGFTRDAVVSMGKRLS